VLGVLVVTLDPQEFVALPSTFEGEDHLVLFLDGKGQVVGGYGQDSAMKKVDLDILTPLESGPGTVRGLGGDERWLAARRLAVFDPDLETDPTWSVIVAERRDAVLKPLARLWWWASMVCLLVLAIVFAVLVVIIPLLAQRLHSAGILTPGNLDSGGER